MDLPICLVLMHPEQRNWISRDEYGNLQWRAPNNSFAADLQNEHYRRNALQQAAAADGLVVRMRNDHQGPAQYWRCAFHLLTVMHGGAEWMEQRTGIIC